MRGNRATETGLNLESFSCRYFPEFKDKLPNYQGQTRGWAQPDKLSREVNFSGEVMDATGIMALKFVTAYTFANTVNTFETSNGGGNSGGFYVDEITEATTRTGWLAVNGRASSDPLVT